MNIEVQPYELAAMQQIVLTVRAIASMLSQDAQQTARILNWAAMVEQVTERAEQQQKVGPRQIVGEEWTKAVKEYELRPGSVTETVVSRIINRLDGNV